VREGARISRVVEVRQKRERINTEGTEAKSTEFTERAPEQRNRED
jgi:hypothetical protein